MNYHTNFPDGFSGKTDPPTQTYEIIIEGYEEVEAYNREDAIEQVKELIRNGDIEFSIN